MEKVKKIELIDYDGHPVETLKFNPPLLLFTDEIQLEDFTIQTEDEKGGTVTVNIQFESESSGYEIYDVDDRTSTLLDYIRYATEEESKLNFNRIEEKIHKAFLTIMQPEGDARFSSDYDDYND